MANPPPQDPNSANGSKSPSHNQNGHGDSGAKLPKAPKAQPNGPAPVSPQTRRDMRRAFLILLTSGLVIGAITAAGVVLFMHRLNLIGVPEQQEQQQP